jgi:hypothetical protein
MRMMSRDRTIPVIHILHIAGSSSRTIDVIRIQMTLRRRRVVHLDRRASFRSPLMVLRDGRHGIGA